MVDARGFQLVPDIAGGLGSGITTGQQIRSNFMTNQKTAQGVQDDQQFRLLTGQILDPSLPPEQRLAAQQARSALSPERDANLQGKFIDNMSARDKQLVTSVARGAAQINSLPTWEGRLQAALERKQRLIRDGLPTDETDLFIKAVESGNAEEAQSLLDQGIKAGQIMGVLEGGANGGASAVKVQSAVALPGGGFRAIMTDGSTKLIKPGSAEADFIKKAEERGAELQGLRSSQRTAGSEAQKKATETFEKLGSVRTSILNIDNAIQALDEGAETGVVASKLPSVRSASIRLDNIQKNMGLDVIGSTTFGALSESELKFAVSSAMPTTLEPTELRKWLSEKKVAQEKLATYLEGAAEFLGTPGNTVAEWNKSQRLLRESQRASGSDEDAAAIEWAKKNPNDPRSATILQMHGTQ